MQGLGFRVWGLGLFARAVRALFWCDGHALAPTRGDSAEHISF